MKSSAQRAGVLPTSARRRRRQRAARRRARLMAVTSFVAAVIVTGLLAAEAWSRPEPYARASAAVAAGQGAGTVSVLAGGRQSAQAGAPPFSAVTWTSADVAASCEVSGTVLVSSSSASLSGVSLCGGRVTADSVLVAAEALATRRSAAPGETTVQVEGLRVDGVPVDLTALPLRVDGLGTLSLATAVERSDGRSAELSLAGLRLVLERDWGLLPEGSEVVVGDVAVAADAATATSLLPSPEDAGEAAGAAGDGAPPAPAAGGASGGGGDTASAGRQGPQAGGGRADAFRPGPLPDPRPPRSGVTLHFPGAVFPVVGRVWYTDDFGAPRADGRGHSGCDIFARLGAPVVAVQAGVVTELRYRSLGGKSFHLVTARGDYFYYAHLDRYAPGIANGSVVRAGQLLGYVGKTGNARTTPPHLHFEIHPGGGAPVDPYPYLELWRSSGSTTPSLRLAGRAVDEPGEAVSPLPQARLEVLRELPVAAASGRPANAGVQDPFATVPVPVGLLVALSLGVLAGTLSRARRSQAARPGLATGPFPEVPSPLPTAGGARQSQSEKGASE